MDPNYELDNVASVPFKKNVLYVNKHELFFDAVEVKLLASPTIIS